MTPNRRRILLAGLALAAVGALVWYLRRDHGPPHYTGFVEGEERVVRSEVTGRVLEVAVAEGDGVPAGTVVARLDDRDARTRLEAKRQELDVLEADIGRQDEQIRLVARTWERDVSARHAELRQAEAGAQVAERTFAREQKLVASGASTAQLLDDARARRDQAVSALERARQILARTEAEEGAVAVARRQADVLKQRRELARAELAELEVTHGKYVIHAPDVATVVQTQFIWPGELAQPGTPIVAVLDPRDKYVQVYVPVADVDRFAVGRRVEVELDSEPGRRFAGEISFVADQANFTPEKIETRTDRMGQVYRAKVRILDGVERLKPGTEGDVYLPG
ncbi:MAG TPA: HlyD family efflux transporter periplasmic adaptor subunit [Candidatus Binatia bacterium]|nr:HlyD family efflux transporter periplasmic adaptor subunit [Candidatus Binatia bacterium]